LRIDLPPLCVGINPKGIKQMADGMALQRAQ